MILVVEELLFIVVAVGLSVDEFASELTDCLSVESTKYHILRELMMPPAAAALARPPIQPGPRTAEMHT